MGFVKDIKYNEGIFDGLILPQDHKILILALTKSQVANKEGFDDIIQGKRKRMIMLLSRPSKLRQKRQPQASPILPSQGHTYPSQPPSQANHSGLNYPQAYTIAPTRRILEVRQ